MTSYLVPCALYNLRSSSPLPSPCTALKREYRPRRKKQRVERHRLRSKALRSNAYGFLPTASFQLHSPHRTAPACVQKEEDSRQSRQGVTCCCPVLCCITWTQRSRLPGVRLGRRSWVLRSNRSGHEIGVLVGIGGHVIAVFGCWCLDLEIWA